MQEAEVVEVVVGLNLLAAPSSRDAIGRGRLAALPLSPASAEAHTGPLAANDLSRASVSNRPEAEPWAALLGREGDQRLHWTTMMY